MMNLVYVGLGGAGGALVRYGLGQLSPSSSFPWATWLINLAGSFLIGWLAARTAQTSWFPGDRLLLMTGFCGGFTTFSTFSLDSLTLMQKGDYPLAFTYMGTSLLLGLACVAVGYWLGQSA